MLTTTNYGLKKPEGTDVVDIQNFNDNADIVDQTLKSHDTQLSDLTYQTAGGTATALTLTMQTLVNGYAKTFIAGSNNGGAATTINGKPLYKPGTTTAPNLIAGKAYTVWYSSTGGNFFIKASAEGNTIASHVLAGDGFSNDNDTGLIGTMSNRAGTKFQICGYEGITECIPHPSDPNGQGLVTGQNLYGNTGYIDANSQVQMSVAGLVPANIKAGVKVGKANGSGTNIMTGTFTSDGTATAGQILNGKTAYVNGNKITGTIPNYSNVHVTGTNKTAGVCSGSYGDSNNNAYIQPTAGYYDGASWVKVAEPELLASNIVNGKSIFGVAGTASVAKKVTGTSSISILNNCSYIDISNCGILPNVLIFDASYTFRGYYGSGTGILYLYNGYSNYVIWSNEYVNGLGGWGKGLTTDTPGCANGTLTWPNVQLSDLKCIRVNNRNESTLTGTVSWTAYQFQ